MIDDEKLKNKLDFVNVMTILNHLEPKQTFVKEWQWAGLNFKYEHRSPNNDWGRFGGGWQWEIGAKWGSTTVIFSLLISTLRISKIKKEPRER